MSQRTVSHLIAQRRCHKCGCVCPIVEDVDVDISGTPCVGSSTRGAMKGELDPSSQCQCLDCRVVDKPKNLAWCCVQAGFSIFDPQPHQMWRCVLSFGTSAATFQSPCRLCHFYNQKAKIMILENVTTGQIKDITEDYLKESKRDWRKLITQPAETHLHCVFVLCCSCYCKVLQLYTVLYLYWTVFPVVLVPHVALHGIALRPAQIA